MSHQSGIKSDENLRTNFALAKNGNIRMLKVSIDNNENLILSKSEQVTSASNSTYETNYDNLILNNIDPKQPCFFFYRLDDITTTGHTWLFITWSPDFASVKHKMLYASTKSTLKQEFGAGQIKDELFGTVADDICLNGYRRHIVSQTAIKPMTRREEEIEEIRKTECLTKINVDTKHKTLQGVMFPIEQLGLSELERFKKGEINYMRYAIDIQGERILRDKSIQNLSASQIAHEIPKDTGRFHLFRYKHTHNNESFDSVIFIYSMAGFSSSVKERMLYSSCKSEVLSYLRTTAGMEISKTFETSEPEEITEEYILDELHPRQVSDSLKFSKPKGPNSRGPRRVTKPTD